MKLWRTWGSPRRMAIFGFVFACSVGPAAEAHAQASVADSVRHRSDCRLAEQVLLHGQPANRRGWALTVFVSCSASAGRIAVSLLHRMDTQTPDQVEEFISAASGLLNRDLAHAAAELASNGSAARETRVHALRILYSQAVPGLPVPYTVLVREQVPFEFTESSVAVGTDAPDPFASDVPVFGTGLAAPEAQRLADRMTALSCDPGAPREVRLAAARVASALAARSRELELCPPGTASQECRARLMRRYRP